MELDSTQAIANRFDDLFLIAENLCEELNADGPPTVEVDTAALYLAVVAMFDDIKRYKDYHLADPVKQRSNAIKRAAYAAKWIMKFNPLICPKAAHISGNNEQHEGVYNAMFAVHYAMSNLEQFTNTQFSFSLDVYYSLVYDLLYRSISGEALILIFEILEKSISQQEIVIFA